MASYQSNLKSWGSTGSEFPDGYNYVEGEQPVDAWDNFVNHNLIADTDHLITLTNGRLESEVATSFPTSPEDGHLVYRTDEEKIYVYNATDGVWADFEDADTLDGLDSTSFLRSDQSDTMSGTLTANGVDVSGGSVTSVDDIQFTGGSVPTVDLAGNNVTITGSGGDVADLLDSGALDVINKLSLNSNNLAIGVPASGSVTLSSGSAEIDTGVSTTQGNATFKLALGADTDDAKVSGRVYSSSSTGTYVVEIVETDTSVGNPTVDYDVIRVR